MSALNFIHELSFEDLSDEVVQFSKRCLLDLVGVAAGGSRTDLSQIIRNHVVENFAAGHRSATLLFDGRTVSPAGAALANGMTIDSLDAHDGHKLTKGHVGCGMFPALLAMAEAEGIESEEEFLTCLVLGYEFGARAGISLHSTVSDYHTSGAWVAVACAAMGARILNLDREQTRHALGIAEYHGPRSQMMRCIDHPTMLKDGSGWGGMAGVSAAYLARDGFTGAPAITLEAPEVAQNWKDLGDHWHIMDQYFKPNPVCRWAQPPLVACLALKNQFEFDVADIERIIVTTFHEATRLATKHPKNTEEAQYSLPYPVAVGLVRGKLGPEEVSADAIADPTVLALAGKIEFAESEEFNKAFPANRIADVTIELSDGRRLLSGPTEAHGDPEAPLSDTEISDKFLTYAAPVLGKANTEKLHDCILDMEKKDQLAILKTLIFAAT